MSKTIKVMVVECKRGEKPYFGKGSALCWMEGTPGALPAIGDAIYLPIQTVENPVTSYGMGVYYRVIERSLQWAPEDLNKSDDFHHIGSAWIAVRLIELDEDGHDVLAITPE